MPERFNPIPSRRRAYNSLDDLVRFAEMGFPLPGIEAYHDGFQGPTLDANRYTTAVANGGTAAAVTAGAAGGRIRFTTGTTDGGSSAFSGGVHYRGDRDAVFIARVVMPAAITGFKFEVGWSDTIAGTDDGLVNSKNGNTWRATDAAALVYDTDDDTNLTLMGVSNGTAATVIDLNTALAAATNYYLGVELRSTRARGFVLNDDGALLEYSTWQESALRSNIGLCFWVYAQTRNTTSKSMDVDDVWAFERKTADS